MAPARHSDAEARSSSPASDVLPCSAETNGPTSLLGLVEKSPVPDDVRGRIRALIDRDFGKETSGPACGTMAISNISKRGE